MNLFELLFNDLITCSCNPLLLSLTPPALYVLQNKLYKIFLLGLSMAEIVREVIVHIIALK